MEKFVFLSVFILFSKCNAFINIDEDGVNIIVNVAYASSCRAGEDRFRTFLGIGLSDCVKECGLRAQCEALSYRRQMQMCALFTTTEDGNLGNGDCTYIPASNIDVIKTPCGTCSYGQVCDTSSNECKSEGCLNTTNNVVRLGNQKKVGSKNRYRCSYGYRNTNGVSNAICQENGTWSTTIDCTRVCMNRPTINNGAATLDKVNGNLYMDTASVTCNIGYNRSTSTISCTASGHWENATCDPISSCYVDNVWTYVGTINVTKTGYPCQRWADNSGDTLVHVSYFPESSIYEAENFCRNPNSNLNYPLWCFTTNPSASNRWEHCDIQIC
ncbi:hyaluronan-binding protein 2-like [Mercenaria mercenaria]|uniref:hyaluronan-binding protein 2-like n=1 Tax=Mercenaria mercenaria TaxID=6596 RepID=UPI00234ED6AC|nr:hyaluronan-binding protein 2-like [Mercenaria mercenaria]